MRSRCVRWWQIKYVGDLEEQRELHTAGLNTMDKVLFVWGARIAFSIWDVGGNRDLNSSFVLRALTAFVRLGFQPMFRVLRDFSIWIIAGDDQFLDRVPAACQDAVAILVLFDLTNRSTLNKSVIFFSITATFFHLSYFGVFDFPLIVLFVGETPCDELLQRSKLCELSHELIRRILMNTDS